MATLTAKHQSESPTTLSASELQRLDPLWRAR
jgi:hypothetical protein